MSHHLRPGKHAPGSALLRQRYNKVLAGMHQHHESEAHFSDDDGRNGQRIREDGSTQTKMAAEPQINFSSTVPLVLPPALVRAQPNRRTLSQRRC